MAVIVVDVKEAFVINPEQSWGKGEGFIEALRDHPRYKAILVKCHHKEVSFYRDMIRDSVAKEGRVDRILQHLERQGIDVVVVEREPKFNTERIRYIGGGREYFSGQAQIVKVDDTIDPEIVQRALDHAAKQSGDVTYESILRHLLDLGVLQGTLTKIEY
jgi:hypothetical protein